MIKFLFIYPLIGSTAMSSEMLREIREAEEKAQIMIENSKKTGNNLIKQAKSNAEDQLEEARRAAKSMVEHLHETTKKNTNVEITKIQQESEHQINELRKQIESKKLESINYLVNAITKAE